MTVSAHQVVLSLLRVDARARELPVIRVNAVARHGAFHSGERVGSYLTAAIMV